MREILFRGKRIDNGMWVYGSLFVGFGKVYICPEAIAMYSFDGALCLGGFYEVDPKTVGQFTGLHNLAEQKIWEDDIVRFDNKTYIVQRECDTPGGYWADTGHILKRIGWSDWLSFVDTIDDYYNEICVEIIGNIHDNHDILKQQ